jgi:AraC-like DNA-binding protein
VHKAKDLLLNGTPIAEAALEAGFFDQSHLNRVFKKFHGVTPGQYSKSIAYN